MDGRRGDTLAMAHAAAITLLPASVADALPLALLSRDEIETGLPWRWRPRRLLACIRDDDHVVLVARSGPELAGFGVMHYGEQHAHLALLAVAPRWRRAGIGIRLLRWLEETAIVAGLERVDLEVREANQGARAFYERAGYRCFAREPGYYEPARGAHAETALRYRRRLRGAAPGSISP